MYLCQNCQQPINSASAVCPYCGAEQIETEPALPKKTRKPPSTLKISIAFLIVVAGIWAIIWFALPLRFASSRPAAERGAIQSLRFLQQQLATYQNGAGNFPASLESLGEPARQAAQAAMSGGYSIHYTPGNPDKDGKAHSYTLLALPLNYGYESLYTDQSGVIHFTRDNRPATPQDPPLK
ncbi:MAG TPA: zinc ribbon domain-containing protein [Verrucomicrobiae bacterium]|nr:zinc ribbon domain-containing protein [Verrucomicrobiae bacterium]